jgi:hypothetical protein
MVVVVPPVDIVRGGIVLVIVMASPGLVLLKEAVRFVLQEERCHVEMLQGVTPEGLVPPGIDLLGIMVPKVRYGLPKSYVLGVVPKKGILIQDAPVIKIGLVPEPSDGPFHVGGDVLVFVQDPRKFL